MKEHACSCSVLVRDVRYFEQKTCSCSVRVLALTENACSCSVRVRALKKSVLFVFYIQKSFVFVFFD